ncbi:MAG: hypothetical protein U9N45_00710 [Gemmatimonadota bacterium]|nr:hypothetical protein [Gemmatimonadota bacterium]
MNYSLLFLIVLILSIVVLLIGMAYSRHSRRLEEKKVQYINHRKEFNKHSRRYQAYQADIERLRSDYNLRMRELRLLTDEVGPLKKEIREVIEILKGEAERVDSRLDQDLVKIIQRRKDIINTRWISLNTKKTAYVTKIQQARQSQVSIDTIMKKKDKEFQQCNEMKLLMERLKKEYEILAKRPIISLRKKN